MDVGDGDGVWIVVGGLEEHAGEPGFGLDAEDVSHALEDVGAGGLGDSCSEGVGSSTDGGVEGGAGAELLSDEGVELVDGGEGLDGEIAVHAVGGGGVDDASEGFGSRDGLDDLVWGFLLEGAEEFAEGDAGESEFGGECGGPWVAGADLGDDAAHRVGES